MGSTGVWCVVCGVWCVVCVVWDLCGVWAGSRWLKVKNADAVVGIVPANYVEIDMET